MARPIALISGDIHYHIYKKFNKDNSRTNTIELFILSLFKHARKLNVPILSVGDLTHTPKGIPTELSERANTLFRLISDTTNGSMGSPLIGISGNHELQEVNTFDKQSPSQFRAFAKAFPEIIKEVDFKVIETKNFIVAGIPYLNHNKGIEQAVENARKQVEGYNGIKILLLHSNAPGAYDTNGVEMKDSANLPKQLGKFFKGFDMVFFGHIHKHQKLWTNIYMVGAPMQQRLTDMGCSMGYLILYDDLHVEFVETNLPQFKTYPEGEPEPNDENYWVMIPKKEKSKTTKPKQFSNKTSKEDLAKNYLKETGIKSPRKKRKLISILNQADEL